MRFDFKNRYFRMVVLWVLMTALIWLAIYFVFLALNIQFPMFLHMAVSMLSAGYLIYRYFMQNLG